MHRGGCSCIIVVVLVGFKPYLQDQLYITLHYASYLVYASYKKLSTGVLQSLILTIYTTYH